MTYLLRPESAACTEDRTREAIVEVIALAYLDDLDLFTVLKAALIVDPATPEAALGVVRNLPGDPRSVEARKLADRMLQRLLAARRDGV